MYRLNTLINPCHILNVMVIQEISCQRTFFSYDIFPNEYKKNEKANKSFVAFPRTQPSIYLYWTSPKARNLWIDVYQSQTCISPHFCTIYLYGYKLLNVRQTGCWERSKDQVHCNGLVLAGRPAGLMILWMRGRWGGEKNVRLK